MATFTLQTYKNEDHSVTNYVVVADGGTVSHTPAQANTLTLPASAPTEFKFRIVILAAQTVTIAAASGDTVTGDTSLTAAGDSVDLVKVSSTVWKSYSNGVATVGSAVADLTFGTNITAATANGSLTDSSATNPTDAQFNELAKELGTKVNSVLAALRAASVIAP